MTTMVHKGRPLVLKLPTFSKALLTVMEYLWAVVVILDGNSVYHSSIQTYYLLESSVVLTILLLGAEVYLRRIPIRRNDVVVMAWMCIYCTVYLTVRQTQLAILTFTYLFVVGLPCLFLLFSTLHRAGYLFPLIRRLFDVVVVLAVISLYYWVFGVMLQMFQPNMYITINWGSFSYAPGFDGLHFALQLDTTFFVDQGVFRNSGIFTEAPMFNLWLDLALAGELFLKNKPSKLRVGILTITIFTTLSLTGILFVVMCLMVYVVWNLHRMDRIISGLILGGLMVILPLIVGLAVHMLTMKADTRSYTMRLSDYTAGFMLWLEYPVFGSGYGDLKSLYPYIYSPDGVLGFSNTLTGVLGTGGLWISILFVIPHCGLLFTQLSGDRRISMFHFCYIYLICANAIFGRYLAVVMIAFGFAILLGPKDMRHKI